MSIINDVLDFLFPKSCHVCGKLGKNIDEIPFSIPSGLALCEDCFEKIIPVDKQSRWLLCLSDPFVGDKYPGLVLYLPFLYDEFFSKAIPAIKFGSRKDLAIFLGRILGSVLKSDEIIVDTIIPVPLSDIRLHERGYNQAELIAKGCSDILNIPITTNSLKRVKNTARQAKIIDKTLRSKNVDKAFQVVPETVHRVIGKKVILLDDVATTGNTLHEAAQCLLDAGVSQVLCVALCGNRSAKNADPF